MNSKSFQATLNRFWDDECGADLVEYALVLTLIAVVAVVVLRSVGDQVTDTFCKIYLQMTKASEDAPGGLATESEAPTMCASE